MRYSTVAKSDITVLRFRDHGFLVQPHEIVRRFGIILSQSKSINSKNVEGPAFFDIYGHIFESVEAFFLEMELRTTLTF